MIYGGVDMGNKKNENDNSKTAHNFDYENQNNNNKLSDKKIAIFREVKIRDTPEPGHKN